MCARVFAVLFSLLLLLLRVLFSMRLKLVVYLRLFLSSLLLLFLGTTTRDGNLFLLLRFVGAHSRVIHDGLRRDLPSVRFPAAARYLDRIDCKTNLFRSRRTYRR